MMDALADLGLERNEIRVYLALLEKKQASAGDIAKRSGIHRRTVYDTLNSLINKGLTSFVLRGRAKIFTPAPPSHLLSLIDEKRDNLQSALPELMRMHDKGQHSSDAQVFLGRRGIITVLEDLLSYPEIWTFGSHGESRKVLGTYFSQHHQKRKEKRIRSRFILSERQRGSELTKALHATIRYLDRGYDSTIATIITEEKVAIIIWSDQPVAVLVRSCDVSTAFRNYFSLIWKIARP